MTEQSRRALVVGLGNPLMGDDGIGLAALERLQEEWVLPVEVEAVDGGTWGMNLLPLIEDSGPLILLDAIDTGAPAGTVSVLERAELPRFFGHKLSPHQIDLREVLALAELRGTLPEDIVAVGLQPGKVEMSTDLSDAAERGLDRMIQVVIERLGRKGYRCTPKAQPSHA